MTVASIRTEADVLRPDAPRFATLWASIVYLLSAMTLAWPCVEQGQFLVGPHSDQYIAGYAFREFAARTRFGKLAPFPLWNPYQFGGMPYVAAMHGDIFYPTFLLRMLMRTDIAMTWGFILHVIPSGIVHICLFAPHRFSVFIARVDRRALPI